MTLQLRRMILPVLVFIASWMAVPATCTAQLLPAADFRGKTHDQWGLEWSEWGIRTGIGGQVLPDIVDGAKFLPPNSGGGDFTANVTIQQGTPLVVSPFFLGGERYDNGTQDVPTDPIIDAIFQDAMIKVSFDGTVVLEGPSSSFPDRRTDITVFPQEILYAVPQPRGGGVNAVASIFHTGLTTIFDGLPLGQHTIRNEFNSPNFFGAATYTYNISVVPEPSTLILLASALLAPIAIFVQRRARLR